MERDVNTLFQEWKRLATEDPDVAAELREIEGNDEAIFDRFYQSLKFGTAGLRGVIGAGTNRMNIYTVNQATQGLADFLNSTYEEPSVAIAYDSRIKSDVFSKSAAGVLAANGIKVYIYKELMPTPMLSFAVRELECQSGIIITASHNPSQYNGYKCYDPEGYQMTDEAANKTYEFIEQVDLFTGVKKMSFEEGLEKGLIEYIDDDVIEEFYSRVLTCQITPGVCSKADLSVIYTPLNGTGNKPVREILRRIGQKNVRVVPEQELPDGTFPTCPYPNPEIKQVFECGIDMSKDDPADLLLATDPDCDRVGIAVKDNGEYHLMSGNEVGAMLLEYILKNRADKQNLPANSIAVKSIVTSDLIDRIAENYHCEVRSLLTGFKYIGELVTNLEKVEEEDRFVFGMEESYGYLCGTHARDKDAVVASMLICEMAAYYKLQGKTLVQVMREIYAKYGMYLSRLLNFAFEGAAGMEKMQGIMDSLRREHPSEIAGRKVVFSADYQSGDCIDHSTGAHSKTGLPTSNVLTYRLEDRSTVIVRPSGTEPKIKVYITAVASDCDAALAVADMLEEDIKLKMHIE